MIYLFCGVIIGIVMGLTGAGGALIAIPLFIQFLGMGLKEASIYSLTAVVLASLINFFTQRKATQYRAGILIVAFSAIGSFIAAPYKELLPTFYVAIILALVSTYALYSVWVPVKESPEVDTISQSNIVLSVIVGLLLGVLTTFTGLGGGVLMLPIFSAFYRFSHPQSVATSLFAVGLSSLASFFVQIHHGTNFDLDVDIILLVIGIIFSVFFLKKLIRTLSLKMVMRARQIVFTLVVILAMLQIF